jgi:hypothetical protein
MSARAGRKAAATASRDVAVGIGPPELRMALVAVALVYYTLLVREPPLHGALRTLGYFAQSTALFPRSDEYAIEFRLEAWSCTTQAWVPMDMRPYFPMHADDKEGRFQRLAYFYDRERTVMMALDDYLVAQHTAGDGDGRDGVTGPIGGIRLYEVTRPIPPLGATIDRYVFDPMGAVSAELRKDKFWTKSSRRAQRCGNAVRVSPVAPAEVPASAGGSGGGETRGGGEDQP